MAVVATSTAAGSVYVGRGLANMRLGMTLEITTTIGGIVGSALAVGVSQQLLSMLFAGITVLTALLMLRSKHDKRQKTHARGDAHEAPARRLGWEDPGKLAGAYFDERAQQMVHYEVVRLWAGAAVALIAGILSGMLGIGGGFLKVPAMNLAMRVPLRVAAATSNVMIGVTAIASLFVYYSRGFVHPTLVAPIVIGVIAGSLGGTVLGAKASPRAMRLVLSAVLLVVAVEMVLRARGVRVV